MSTIKDLLAVYKKHIDTYYIYDEKITSKMNPKDNLVLNSIKGRSIVKLFENKIPYITDGRNNIYFSADGKYMTRIIYEEDMTPFAVETYTKD